MDRVLNTVRLLTLADALEADASNPKGMKFDLALWAGKADVERDDEGDVEDYTTHVPAANCGTVGCAVGLACMLPEFNAQGLAFKPGWLVPLYDGKLHWSAVQAFFGLNKPEDEYLFSEEHYENGVPTQGEDGERAVAARIRDVVANGFPEHIYG